MKFKAFGFGVLAFTCVAMAQEPLPRPQPPPGEHRPGGPERARRLGPDRPEFGPDRPPPPRRPEWRELPETERKAVLKFMEEHFPRMAVEMDQLKESSPQRYERRMTRVAGEMHRLIDVSERDPRRATVLIRERQVALEIQELAKDYRSAKDDDEKTRIRKNVRELVSKEFDSRMERRNMEVRELETKLAELKSRLSEMKSVRDDMLERRMRELLNPKPKRDSDEDEDGPGDREPPPGNHRPPPPPGDHEPPPPPDDDPD